jgi:orotate phosphoribosyltransferase
MSGLRLIERNSGERDVNDENLGRDVNAVARLQGEFRLRSGALAHEYFDKYRFESDPALLLRVARKMLPLLPNRTQALAGLELGGVPIATAMSLQSGLPVAFVRKAPKEYGTRQAIEGRDLAGLRTVLIEDVITTGGAVADATRLVRAAGGEILGVVCAIWRGDGEPHIAGIPDLPVYPALTRADLI